MMNSISKDIRGVVAFLTVACLLGFWALSARSDVTGRPHDLSLDNPRGHCINCHDLHQTGLGAGFAHNLKRANEIAVCYQCHAGAESNYTSIDPSYPNWTALISSYNIKAEFEETHTHFALYGMDGEHNKCSHCHNPHGVFDATSSTRLPKLLSTGPDVVTDTDEYCLVCHNSDPSPPHEPFANISVGDQYRFSRTTYKAMTHSTFTRATTTTEPVPDTAFTYDDNPYAAGKDISCLTCHRPHGSPYDHMLKGPDDQSFCLGCHDGDPAADLAEFTVTGHGKSGVDRICQECHFPHGTGQENAVKTVITDPHTGSDNPVDVTSNGMNDACLACHDTSNTVVYSKDFASDISGWSTGGLTQTFDPSVGHFAPGSLKQVAATAGSYYSYNTNYYNVNPDTPYVYSAYIYLPEELSGTGSYLRLYEYNSSNGTTATLTSNYMTHTGDRWQYVSINFTTQPTTVKVRFFLYANSAGTIYWDDVSVVGVPYDSGYFRGGARYDASIHNTSPAAHNPSDVSGDQQPGECGNCHDPHGRGYAKMALDAAENLCYDCHNASTPNTLSGDDVQAAFQSAYGHDLAQVDCVDCHNVHTVTQSSYLMDPHNTDAEIADGTEFCLGCHTGEIPAGVGAAPDISPQWDISGHNQTGAIGCLDCHEPHGSPNAGSLNYRPVVYGGYTAGFASGADFTTRTFCEACHNRAGSGYKGAPAIPTGTGYVGQHQQADGTPCSDCHSLPHDPRLSNYTGADSFYTIACLECHTQGQDNPYPDPDAQFNTPTDSGDVDTMRSTHALTYDPYTTAVVDCTACHGADHETDHNDANRVFNPDTSLPQVGGLDISTSNGFCFRCHDSSPVSIGGMEPRDILESYSGAGHGMASASLLCSDCHVYHGSASERLLRQTINSVPVLSDYSGNNSSVCTACHRDADAALPLWPGFDVYSSSIHAYGNDTTGNYATDGRHGPGVCVNCHDPHARRIDGELTHNMTKKDGEGLCFICHASGFDNFSTSGDYNGAWTRYSDSILGIEKSGGLLKYGRTVVYVGDDVDDGLERVNAFPDEDCTVTVKLRVDEITRTDGAARFGIRIYDQADPLNYTLGFFRANTSPRVWMARYTDDGGASGLVNEFGDESTTFHTLKLVRRKAAGEVDAYIDDTLMRTCQFTTGGRFAVRLYCSVVNTADATPEAVELSWDDFSVVYDGETVLHNTASGDDVLGRFDMKSRHDISDEDQLGDDGLPGTADDSKVECYDCHDPHTITETLMAYENISGEITPVEADQNFCLKCHDGDPPAGVLFPEEGVWDKSAYTSSAHGNDRMRDKTFGNYSSGITYACKVCHNPHGSDQAALQRESWDINRDGIPDDIDGDGILDSTDMVGYIGYSTGTRKVILVDSPRAGFERVSSTMPYQENGTIDVELCLNCHDGTPAPDVETDFGKLSHHDVTYADQTSSGGSKIECYHCHDQHRAQARDDQAGEYPTTNPDPPREPMPGDAQFCLRCHDNSLPEGVSFGAEQLKNVKLSYNPGNHLDGNGYDIITTFIGHYDQDTGVAMMCRECHNQHGSSFRKLVRDDTNPAGAYYDPAQPVQGMHTISLRPTDAYSGGDSEPQSSVSERCLGCHSGETTYNGKLIPLPPPPDADSRGFSMPPVGKHPDMSSSVTFENETGGHIYYPSFAVLTSPGSVKDPCTLCHDSHNPYIATVSEQLMDCYQCHNENTSLPDVQSEFNDNPTNPTRSASIHPINYDPTGTDPSYVECLKCHDQSKHMLGTVRLRKDPTAFDNYTTDADVWADPITAGTINQFCLECHDSGSAVAESFWRDSTEHVPPKLPAGHSTGAHFVNGGLKCTDCHEYHGSVNHGLRKNAFGEEETFCFGCHNNPSNSQNGVDISSKFAMSHTHDVDDADQASSGTAVECEDCHNPHVVTRTNPVVSVDDKNSPVTADSAFCAGCHDTDGGPGVRFAGYTTGVSEPEWDTADGTWNRWDKSAFAGSPHDLGGIACLDCHDPHGSPNYSLLLANISTATGVSVGFGTHSTARGFRTEELGVNSVCAACHADAMGVYAGYSSFTSLTFGHKLGIDKNCTYCHNPHGTTENKLIRSSRPLEMDMGSADFGSVYNFKGFSNSSTGAPYYTFCSSRGCHGTGVRPGKDMFSLDCEPDTYMDSQVGSSHHPIKEGLMGCNSCHNEHGSVNAPDLRAPYYREDNWPILFKSGIGVYDNYRPYGSGSQFLGSDVNYFEKARSGLPDNTNRDKVTTVNPPDDANDLCFMCHYKQDIIGSSFDGMSSANTNFLGHEAVEGGATITQNISRSTNGIGTEYHKFSCSACHMPHSIGRPKLVKQGCFSRSDGGAPNSSWSTANYCHGYNGWTNWNYGWRNLTGLQKTDFNRPANAVDDLSFTLDADLTLHLDWTAVEDEPSAGADHYNVYRAGFPVTQESKPYAERYAQGVGGGAVDSPQEWTDYTCQPNTTYYYAVVACDAENNESFVSNCVEVSVGSDITPPAALSDQLTEQKGGTYSVNLGWSDPGDNVNVTEYRVYRLNAYTTLVSGDIVPGNYIGSVTDTSQSADGSGDSNAYLYTDTTTSFGQDYSYAVVAADLAGNVSALPTGSTFSVSIVDPAPAEVTDLAARPLVMEYKSELTWTEPVNVGAVSGYNVYRKEGAPLTQSDLVPGNMIAGPVAGLTYTDDLAAYDTLYYYAVTALDDSSGKESKLGNNASVNLPAPATSMLAVRRIDSSIDLWWSPPAYTTNLTGYKVYTRRDLGAWTYEKTVTTNSGTLDLLGRIPGSYEISVSAQYSTYGGTTPYGSVLADPDTLNITDTAVPESFTAAGSLIDPAKEYAHVEWLAPADLNYTGFTPAGVDHYRISASYNRGATWGTAISSRLTNPGFESHDGTVDDTGIDNFTGWVRSNTNTYAVSDSFFDSRAIKIVYTGSGDRYIYSNEPDTGSSIAGAGYSVSFWAKANKNTNFEYFIQSTSGPDEKPGLTSTSIGTSWQRFTAYGVFSGSATATYARVVIRPSSDTTANIIIDGVRFEHGTAAIGASDGTFYRPTGYDTPGSAQNFDDPKKLTLGGSAIYRVSAVDAEWNLSSVAQTGEVYAKPTTVSDLEVTSSTTTSGNVLEFSPSVSVPGINVYNIYAREQGFQLYSTGGATLIASLPATMPAGNAALAATATASHVYSASSSYKASNANDGNSSTAWYGQAYVGPNWLMLDFGSEVLLDGVSFSFYNNVYNRPKDYLVQTYDGGGWVTQESVTGNASNTPSYTFSSPVSTDKVRIYITNVYDNRLYSYPIIYEFNAYALERYVHDLSNTTLKAEVGQTYAYAVIAEDVNGLTSALSSGPSTVNTVTDADAPDKVTDLALTSEVGGTEAVLSWSTPLDNLGFGAGTGATQYEVYRLPTGSTGTPEAVTDDNYTSASLVASGSYASSVAGTLNNYTATWYDHLGVYYAVRSVDAAGNWSVLSNSPYIVVGKDTEAPDPPVITSCVPVTSPEVDVYWDPATDNVGINGYKLYRADVTAEPFATDGCITENNAGLADVAIALIPYNADSAADTGGTPGVTYYFGLVAWDDENNVSSLSNCGVATVRTTATDTTAPTWGPTPLTAVQQPYPDIDLFWDAATDLDDSAGAGSIDHYDIYRNTTSFTAKTDPGVQKIATVSGVRHSYVDNTGNHDTKYWYAVIAVDASVNANASALSNVASATVAVAPTPDNTPPSVPADLAVATGVYPYLNVTWTASTDTDDAANPQQLMYYKLYRSDYPLDITEANKDITAQVKTYIMANDAVSYPATGTGGAVYNFRLEAFDNAGNPSGLSTQVIGTVADAPCTDTTPPSAPANLDAVIGPSPDMDLSWSASTDSGACYGAVDQYRLYRSENEITVSTDLRTITPLFVAGNYTTIVDSTGEPNTEYWYVLTAVDTSGNESDRSNIIVRTTAVDSMAPASIADLMATPDTTYMRLTWCRPSDNVGVDHYEIYRKQQGAILTDGDIIPANKVDDFINNGVCLSYDDYGVSAATTYSYAVIAVDAAGNRSTISRGESTGDTIGTMP